MAFCIVLVSSLAGWLACRLACLLHCWLPCFAGCLAGLMARLADLFAGILPDLLAELLGLAYGKDLFLAGKRCIWQYWTRFLYTIKVCLSLENDFFLRTL